MSGFIGAAQPVSRHCDRDLLLNRMDFLPWGLFQDVWAIAPASFKTEWWPKGGGLMGDQGLDVGMLEASWWGAYNQAAGASSSYGWTGTTRDQYGSPLASCNVYLFRTSDCLLIYTTTSDPNGTYYVATPYYPDAHFVVWQKTGSPDVQGVSVFTLIGT